MAGCTPMFVQALARFLSVAMPVALIGLACWSPLLAAPRAESPAPGVSQRSSEAPPPGSSYSRSAGTVIVGRVLYRGPVPPPTQMEVDQDQDVCGATISMVALSVDAATYGLRNAVVHVVLGAGGVPAGVLAAPPAVIQKKQCRFHPHVGVAQVGNEMEIHNDDPVMHNTNITVDKSTTINMAMVAGESPIKKLLTKSGLHSVKCNVHEFMQAYWMVFDDPYFDRTTEAGKFRISNLPPGLHMVTVWHEALGIAQKEVQVPAQGTVSFDLEFK